jgi:hypothetical protein
MSKYSISVYVCVDKGYPVPPFSSQTAGRKRKQLLLRTCVTAPLRMGANSHLSLLTYSDLFLFFSPATFRSSSLNR